MGIQRYLAGKYADRQLSWFTVAPWWLNLHGIRGSEYPNAFGNLPQLLFTLSKI